MRLTLFGSITLLVLALAVATPLVRLRGWRGRWFVPYYVVILGYALGFPYSLNLAAVCVGLSAGILSGLGNRATGTLLRTVEAVFCVYVIWRCLESLAPSFA